MADNNQVELGKQIYQYFLDKGLPEHQAAAIAGNMAWESGGTAGAGSIAVGDNTKHSAASPHSFGIAQWNDRLPGLIDYARSQGKDIPQGDLRDVNYLKSIAPKLDLNTQLGYAWDEMHGPESRAFKSIQAGNDIASANEGAISYHRPAGWTWSNPSAGHGFDKRVELSKQIMSAGGDNSVIPPGITPTPVATFREQPPAEGVETERATNEFDKGNRTFDEKLAALDTHLAETKAQYSPQQGKATPSPEAIASAAGASVAGIGGPAAPVGSVAATPAATPNLNPYLLMQALQSQQQQQQQQPTLQPQGTPNVLASIANPAAASSTGTQNMLRLMSLGRDKSNLLAILGNQAQGSL